MTVTISEQVSPESEWDPPIPADRTPAVLGGIDDLQLLAIVGSEPRGSERRAAACELLVGRYRGMVWSCAQRYCRSPEPAEDLLQAGYIGLLKAINNFDPTFGRSLAAYAQPCIFGEIKRHFRDTRWQIHVQRPAKELAMEVRAVIGQLTQELGRTPSEPDLARYLAVSAANLREARLADLALRPTHWTSRCPVSPARLAWPTASAGRTRGSTTSSASPASPPTRASCPRASSRSRYR